VKKITGLLLPVYNHETTIVRTLNTIIPQLSDTSVLLIIDDASTDSSVSLIRKLVEKNSNLKLVENPINLGNIENMFYGVSILLNEHSELRYFSLLGPDDIYEQNWLSKCVEALDNNPTVSGSQSWSEYFWSSGEKFLNKYESISQTAKLSKLNQTLKLSDMHGDPIRYTNFIGGVMKVEFAQKYLANHVRLLESLFLWEDLIHLLMIKRGGIVSVPELLFRKNKNLKGEKSDNESKYPGADFSRKLNSAGSKLNALLFLQGYFLIKRTPEFLGLQKLILIVLWNRGLRPKISTARRRWLQFW